MKMKPKLWVVKGGASERSDKILTEERKSRGGENFLKCIRSNDSNNGLLPF